MPPEPKAQVAESMPWRAKVMASRMDSQRMRSREAKASGLKTPAKGRGEVEVAAVLRGARVHPPAVELEGVAFHVRHGHHEAPVEVLAAVGAEDAELLEAGAYQAARFPVGVGDAQAEGAVGEADAEPPAEAFVVESPCFQVAEGGGLWARRWW